MKYLVLFAALLVGCTQQFNAPAPVQTQTVTAQAPVQTVKPFGWWIGAKIAPTDGTGYAYVDVDGFQASAASVQSLKSGGAKTICYLDVGSWEPGRPDSSQYPNYLKVQKDPDWPQEYFLDVTDVFKPQSALAPILINRFNMCKQKGFDYVEPDNLQNDENITSKRKPTLQQQIDFNGWVADAVHAAGLKVLQKNGPDKILLTDRTGQRMLDKFDGIINEECQQYKECGPLKNYVLQGKFAINVEYGRQPDCEQANSLGLPFIRRDLALRAPGEAKYNYVDCAPKSLSLRSQFFSY